MEIVGWMRMEDGLCSVVGFHSSPSTEILSHTYRNNTKILNKIQYNTQYSALTRVKPGIN